jgi:hypothetical protein
MSITTATRRIAVAAALALAALPAASASADDLNPLRQMKVQNRLATSVGNSTVTWQKSLLRGVYGVSVSGGYGGNMTGTPFMDAACAATTFTVTGSKVDYSTTVGIPAGVAVTVTPGTTSESVTFRPLCRRAFNNIWVTYSGVKFTGEKLNRITESITYTAQKTSSNINVNLVATESDLP